MNHNEFGSRLAQIKGVEFDGDMTHSLGTTRTADFRIGGFADWPDKFDLDESPDNFPTFISKSSASLKPEGDVHFSSDEYRHALVDELVVHLPPFRSDEKELVESYFSYDEDRFTFIYGQRIGFGAVEPDWGIVPHLYLNDDETCSPESVLEIARQAANLIQSEEPIRASEIA